MADDEDSVDPEIFVTVGTELPFDRLVHAVDEWAVKAGVSSQVFAQIGNSDEPPATISHAAFLDGPRFDRYFRQAKLVVSHAGMGTILTALQMKQTLLVMPRVAAFGEHRSEHQLATAARLKDRNWIAVASDTTDLELVLDARDTLHPAPSIGPYASPTLIAALQAAILVLSGAGSEHVP